MDVPLVLLVPRLPERQHAVEAHVVPERRGVLPPDPVGVAVLDLVARPATVAQQFVRDLALAGVLDQPVRVGDRAPGSRPACGTSAGSRPTRPSSASSPPRWSGARGLHRPVADRQRLLPDVVAGDVVEPDLGVQADDVAGEVAQRVAAGVAGSARPCSARRSSDRAS